MHPALYIGCCFFLALTYLFVMYRSHEREVMALEFFCGENRVNDWTNHWKRQRLVWWRKFANVRSNYSLYEEQADLEPGLHNQTFIQVFTFHGHAIQGNSYDCIAGLLQLKLPVVSYGHHDSYLIIYIGSPAVTETLKGKRLLA